MGTTFTTEDDVTINIVCSCCDTKGDIGWRAFLEEFQFHATGSDSTSIVVNFRGSSAAPRHVRIDSGIRRVLAAFGIDADAQHQLVGISRSPNALEM